MDTVPGKVLNDKVTRLVKANPRVHDVEEVLAHRFGPYLVLNVTIGIDGTLSVAEGDDIATQVEKVLKRQIEMLQRVHVHYHPVREGKGQG
ncbi:cation transporter dimerization domain-containing protein, partial [Candidatus Latescibacterota bacterium]